MKVWITYGLFFRVIHYVAHHWLPPFFGGCALSMALMSWGNVELINLFSDAFDASFNAVVASCVP